MLSLPRDIKLFEMCNRLLEKEVRRSPSKQSDIVDVFRELAYIQLYGERGQKRYQIVPR